MCFSFKGKVEVAPWEKSFFGGTWPFRLSEKLFYEDKTEGFPEVISGSEGDFDRELEPECESDSDSES